MNRKKIKKCEVCNSRKYVFYRKRYKMYLCEKHIAQMKLYGKVKLRTKFSANELKINSVFNYVMISLYNDKIEEVTQAFVDLEDIDKIKPYKWRLNPVTGYVVTNTTNSTLLLHRLIMDNPKGYYIDHIDKNKRNCCKENLSIIKSSENLENSKIYSNNTSGYKGVYKIFDKWRASLTKKGKKYYKDFNTKKVAYAYRKYLETKYFLYKNNI